MLEEINLVTDFGPDPFISFRDLRDIIKLWQLEHFEPILTKKDFVQRYGKHEFGNCSPTWNNFESWNKDNLGRNKLSAFHIRNRVAGGITWYDVRKYEMFDKWSDACSLVGKENLYISAMCPTEKTVLQGEVMQSEKGLYLFYSQVAKPMRDALREEAHEATGLKAKFLLEQYLDWNSLDWLYGLLNRYPEHVIEFTTLSVKWGTIPGYNTLFWEVRKGY